MPPQRPPAIGEDVTDLMPAIGADVTDLMGGAPATAAPAQESGASWFDVGKAFVGGVVEGLNPLPLLKSIYEDSRASMDAAIEAGKRGEVGTAATKAVRSSPLGQSARLLGAMGAAQWDQLEKGRKAYDEGRVSEAIGHTMAGLLPVVGPVAGHIGEEAGSGDPVRAARGAGLAASVGVPAAAAKALPSSVRIPGTGLARNPNAAERAAVAYGEQAGIPIDAATATGNPVVRGVQWWADRSLGGAIPGQRAAAAQTEALQRVSGQLSSRAAPAPTSPELAGVQLRGAVTHRVEDLAREAQQQYGTLAQIEDATAAPVRVGTRTRELPVTGAKIDEPIMETMGLPLNVKGVRDKLRPLYDRLKREAELVPLMGEKGRALTALDRLMKGPDVVPASVADGALSELKALSRFDGLPELRPEGKGIAAQAVQVLEDQVQRAVEQGGPAATAARNAGRAATKEKYRIGEILDDLKEEPVRAYRQATLPDDQNIAYLRKLKQVAPQEMKKVGRAFLEDLFSDATAEGGFSRAQGLQARWQKLGPETKRTLFPDSALRADLDNFFLLAKRIAENPNPSGTALTAAVPAQGALALMNPANGAIYTFGSAAISKLLHSRVGIKALTEALTVPLGNRAKAGMAVSRAAALAGLSTKDRIPLSALPSTAEEGTSPP